MTASMDKIKCVIVDDEPLPIELLSDYIHKTPGLELICALRNPVELLHLTERHQIHILFLDIQMPQLTGLQLARLVQGRCEFVITSAYPQYALDGYEYDVVDYLLKPFSFDRFLSAINKCKKRLSKIYTGDSIDPSHFFVKTGNRLRKIYHSEVLYLEAMRDYIAIHMSLEKVMTLQSLSSFEEQLPVGYVRIHRSYIINMDKITYIENGAVVIQDVRLPIGDKYQDRLAGIK